MKIIHVFNTSIVSGPETLAIPALPHMKSPVAVIFLEETRLPEKALPPQAYAKSFGLETHSINVRSRLDFEAVKKLERLLNQLDPAIVHAHDVKASLYLALANWRSRRVIISTHHGIEGRPDFRSRVYERLYSHLVLKAFSATVAVSTVDYTELSARGLPKEKLALIWNGIDQKILTPTDRIEEQAKARAAWNLDLRTPKIGLVCRLSREKRVDRSLKMAAELDRLDPKLPWELVIFGEGKEKEALEQLSESLKIRHRVHWMGYRKQIAQEMAGFNVLLSLSDAEGQPISILEAGYAGTPVLATEVGGIPDIIPDANFGITVPLTTSEAEIANSLLALLKSEARQRQLGQALQNRVSTTFSRAMWIQKHRDLYSQFFPPKFAK